MSVLPVGFGSSGGLQISNSVRLRASASAYFSRTFGAPTDNLKWTWSGWVKRGTLGAIQTLFGQHTDSNNRSELWFDASDKLSLYCFIAGVNAFTAQTTAAVYRDPSAHYHVQLVWDSANGTAANRLILYVNGVSAAGFSGSGVTVNQPSLINSAAAHYHMRSIINSTYSDGYLSDVYFVDGQALTPSSFGETNSDGVWVPKAYSGTYGTNGFHLDFKDAAVTAGSNAGLGKDVSGNGNYWTTNNISVTAGVTYDSMVDTPTNNYATLNPIDLYGGAETSNAVAANANLSFTVASGNAMLLSSIAVSSGKWYFEAFTQAGTIAGILFGVAKTTSARHNYVGFGTDSWALYPAGSCNKMTNNSGAGSGTSYIGTSALAGEVCCCAVDMDAGKIWWRLKDGVWGGAAGGDPVAGTGEAFSGLTGPAHLAASGNNTGTIGVNFGQRPFTYTPPTGFKALCTANLPAVAIPNPREHFDAYTYTGANATTAGVAGDSSVKSGIVQFAPDLVWLKNRGAALNNVLRDTLRGAFELYTNSTTNEQSADPATNSFGYIKSLDATGFTIGRGNNVGTPWRELDESGYTYAAWLWKANGAGSSNTDGDITTKNGSVATVVSANQTAGFSVVSFTCQTSAVNATVGHGLGIVPSLVIVKPRTGSVPWTVWHSGIANTEYLVLNTAAAKATAATYWNSTTPTTSVFTLGTSWNSAGTAVAYCFAEIAGYSKFGSYVSNNVADGPFVFCGFSPKWLLIRSAAAGHWILVDAARNTYNVLSNSLAPNSPNAENGTVGGVLIDFTATGFKVRCAVNADINYGSAVNIFAAFAEFPQGGSNVSPAPAR